jgi:hypothetical protein
MMRELPLLQELTGPRSNADNGPLMSSYDERTPRSQVPGQNVSGSRILGFAVRFRLWLRTWPVPLA